MMIQYEHHGKTVWVREDLKGLHRQHCLCHTCGRWPKGQEHPTCQIAKALYQICCEFGVVTPVWECPGWLPLTDVPGGQGSDHT
jgi:hypothetical protein